MLFTCFYMLFIVVCMLVTCWLHVVYILFTYSLHIVCLSKCLSETEQLPPLGSWPSWVLEEATEATCVLNGFHPKGAMCGKTWQNYVQTTYKPCDMCQLDDTKTAGCFAGQASLSLSKRRWRQHAETDTFNSMIEAHTPFQPMPQTCSNNPKYTMGDVFPISCGIFL